jgi:putative membrane protein
MSGWDGAFGSGNIGRNSLKSSGVNSPADPFEGSCPSVSSSDRGPWLLPSVLLAIFIAGWLALAVSPVSREDWLLENLLVVIAVPSFVVAGRRLRFSNASYLCLFVFFVLHSIGAHYTYSLVPYDRWFETLSGRTVSEVLGWERNHYDRVIHFLYGALILPPAAELFERYAPPRGVWRWLMPVFFVMSHSVIYEMIEWAAALIVAPDLGSAYLGTQGDEWDAQKDMALATSGAAFSMSLLRMREMRSCRAR